MSDKKSKPHNQVARLKQTIRDTLAAKEDGYFGSGEDGKFLLRSAEKMRCTRTMEGHFGHVFQADWGGETQPDMLVSVGQDGKFMVWNAKLALKTNVVSTPGKYVMSCAVEKSQGELMCCGSLDNQVNLYYTSLEQCENHFEGAQRITTPVKEFDNHDGYVGAVAFNGSGEIISASGDRTIAVLDVAANSVSSRLLGHGSDVLSVAVNPQNPNLFISASLDLTCKLWDLREHKCVMTFEGHEADVNAVRYFPDGMSFASGSDDSSCRLFDTRAMQEVNVYRRERDAQSVSSVAFSSSGALLFSSAELNVTAWVVTSDDSLGQDLINSTKIHRHRVAMIGVQCEGKALQTASWDGKIRVWA